MLKRLLVGAAGLGLLAGAARAQPTRADSALLAAGVRAVQQRYAAAVQGEGHLLSGPQYVEHRKEYLTGSPYFPNDNIQHGTVLYDGFAFENVPLRYDARTDQVMFYPATRSVVMRLVPQKLASFTAGGHRFIRLETDTVASPHVRTGYYELLADGPVRLLGRRVVRISERALPTGRTGSYYPVNSYLVQQGSTFTPVSRLGDVTRLFPGHKAALRRYVRTSHLYFRDATREWALSQVVAHLNRLLGS